jgi:uncharacterized membrane protein
MSMDTRRKFLITGSFILGFGFLGALDGIIFHQLLQWHSVYMDTTRPGQIMSDGWFHLAVSIALVAGGILLWLGGNPGDHSRGIQMLLGGFLIGGGTFNFVEGLINHHILQIHRVKPGDPNALAYDLAFLASGLILAGIGLFLYRSAKSGKKSLGA